MPWLGVNQLLFYGSAAFSALIGGFISTRLDRGRLLWAWVTLGLLSTLLLPFSLETPFLTYVSALLGVALGLGLCTCFALLSESTKIEERTRTFSLVIVELFVNVALVMFVAQSFSLGINERVALVLISRILSFAPLIVERVKLDCNKASIPVSSNKNFILYLIPWILFNIAAGLSFWYTYRPSQNYSLDEPLAAFYLSTAIFGIVSGFLADRIGRKTPAIVGIVLGGISFAILSLFASVEGYFMSDIVLGVAWGFLLVVYMAIPGDIAQGYAKERFYALGIITPLMLYFGINAIPRGQVDFDISRIFPVISMLLFGAIIPIVVAKETLPPEKIRARRFKQYMNELGKVLEESKQK
jgi:MFS family permease